MFHMAVLLKGEGAATWGNVDHRESQARKWTLKKYLGANRLGLQLLLCPPWEESPIQLLGHQKNDQTLCNEDLREFITNAQREEVKIQNYEFLR